MVMAPAEARRPETTAIKSMEMTPSAAIPATIFKMVSKNSSY